MPKHQWKAGKSHVYTGALKQMYFLNTLQENSGHFQTEPYFLTFEITIAKLKEKVLNKRLRGIPTNKNKLMSLGSTTFFIKNVVARVW